MGISCKGVTSLSRHLYGQKSSYLLLKPSASGIGPMTPSMFHNKPNFIRLTPTPEKIQLTWSYILRKLLNNLFTYWQKDYSHSSPTHMVYRAVLSHISGLPKTVGLKICTRSLPDRTGTSVSSPLTPSGRRTGRIVLWRLLERRKGRSLPGQKTRKRPRPRHVSETLIVFSKTLLGPKILK